MAGIKEFIADAKRNRDAFLRPYRDAFDKGTEKERAKIVIQLIQMEPSHHEEPWISGEITRWLSRQNDTDIENLKSAFVNRGKRDHVRAKDAKWFSLVQRADAAIAKAKTSKYRVFQKMATHEGVDRWTGSEDDAEMQIRARYYDHKKRHARRLPFPYWGRDIIETEDAFIVKNPVGGAVIELNGQKIPHWGSWEMKIPK